MMSLWQCPGFCVSRKSGQEGGRWLHPKGPDAKYLSAVDKSTSADTVGEAAW